MKKLVYTLLILASYSFLTAQNFAPVGAVWHYQNYCSTPPWQPSDCSYFIVEVVGDTIINGDYVTKIQYGDDNGNYSSNSTVFLKEENDKVYFYENEEFKLLYDFTLQTGDTLTFNVPQNWHFYSFSCGDGDASTLKKMYIDSVSSTITNSGDTLKVLHPKHVPEVDYWSLQYITEKIGTPMGLFGGGQIFCLGGFSGHFRCYEDTETNYKTVEEACDHVTGLEKPDLSAQFTLYPNPSQEKLTVSTKQNALQSIRILSITNQEFIVKENLQTNKTTLMLDNLPTGVYWVQIEDIQHNLVIKKLLKH